MMSEVQLKARCALYDRLAFYAALAERAETVADHRHWIGRAATLERAIDTMCLLPPPMQPPPISGDLR